MKARRKARYHCEIARDLLEGLVRSESVGAELSSGRVENGVTKDE